MKPHLEERNKRLRDEYTRRKSHGENRNVIIGDLADREHLSEDTTRIICQTEKYGHYGKRKPRQTSAGLGR